MTEPQLDPHDFKSFEQEIEQIKAAFRSLGVTTYKESYDEWNSKAKSGVSHSQYSKIVSSKARYNRRNGIEKLCKVLSIDISRSHSDDSLGTYSKISYQILSGAYYLIRPTFDKWDTIGRYPVYIRWDSLSKCYVMTGTTHDDGSVVARISIPSIGQYYEIHSSEMGCHSLTIVNMMNSKGIMYGQILTLGEEEGRPDRYRPICAPVVIMAVESHNSEKPDIVDKGHSDYAELFAHLRRVYDKQYAEIVSFFNAKP